MTKNDFAEFVVLITGAAGGIGTAVSGAFEARGATVYRTDLRPMNISRFIAGDVSDPAFARSCIDRILSETGRLDVLVNNAGICPRTSIPAITPEEWKQVLDVNLTSVFLFSQACMEPMTRQKSGCIVNLASLAGKVGGIAVGAHYSASKAAIACLTKSFARHGAAHGVRVNAVAPGIIRTEMTEVVSAEDQAALLKSIPVGRFGTADEVAEVILFLASRASTYITGTTVDVNGGLLMD